jgi:hypothetical protein
MNLTVRLLRDLAQDREQHLTCCAKLGLGRPALLGVAPRAQDGQAASNQQQDDEAQRQPEGLKMKLARSLQEHGRRDKRDRDSFGRAQSTAEGKALVRILVLAAVAAVTEKHGLG